MSAMSRLCLAPPTPSRRGARGEKVVQLVPAAPNVERPLLLCDEDLVIAGISRVFGRRERRSNCAMRTGGSSSARPACDATHAASRRAYLGGESTG